MNIFKSIKWRLQLWYGLILVLVLAGFGFTAYQLERGRQFGRIDNELQRRFGMIANALPAPPHRRRNFNRPPPEDFPGEPPPQNARAQKFILPPQAQGLFGAKAPGHFYFIVARDAKEMARSENAPAKIPPAKNDFQNPVGEPPPLRKPPPPATTGNFRELSQTLPTGETILVGCSIAPELRELKMTALKLSGFGAIILIFGLAGGGWLVSRAIKPIEQISATAVKISAGDLSQRISLAETENELGQLAAVLNSTFARLETAFAQQKQFASDAAHELRTPVSVILTQTQTALNRDREARDYKETIEACQRAAQRMRKLISALLELARLDAGQEPMKQLRFDFSKMIADGLELIRPLADADGIKILAELSPLEISGDAGRLAQVVTNLLTNAIQYNHAGGEVRVKLEAEHGLAILKISDTGRGIAPEDLPRVFERFYRADKSRSSGNAGLGLAISQAIVEAHGGAIEVSSEENIGTIFTIRLPT